ncbi:MAG: antibiotic biosynthesis monooxygenase [Chloroflexi bacterium]|nr:antibiotic biosynthesis monooxygenase [Chloroflexota bacterium]
MYGSIFRMKVKPGQEQKVIDLFNEWDKVERPKVKGAIAGYVMKPDSKSGELIGVAVFQDKASYRANAERPEQDRWFRKMREHLQADPQWEDGEYLRSQLPR